MYRILFNPKLAQWEVQLARLGIFWRRVDAGPFKDYDQAAAYVEQVGLPRVYRNWNDRPSLFGGHTDDMPRGYPGAIPPPMPPNYQNAYRLPDPPPARP